MRVHRSKGNIRSEMKRESSKWYVASSTVTGVDSIVIVLAAREEPTVPPRPFTPCLAAWNWDR